MTLTNMMTKEVNFRHNKGTFFFISKKVVVMKSLENSWKVLFMGGQIRREYENIIKVDNTKHINKAMQHLIDIGLESG